MKKLLKLKIDYSLMLTIYSAGIVLSIVPALINASQGYLSLGGVIAYLVLWPIRIAVWFILEFIPYVARASVEAVFFSAGI